MLFSCCQRFIVMFFRFWTSKPFMGCPHIQVCSYLLETTKTNCGKWTFIPAKTWAERKRTTFFFNYQRESTPFVTDLWENYKSCKNSGPISFWQHNWKAHSKVSSVSSSTACRLWWIKRSFKRWTCSPNVSFDINCRRALRHKRQD